MVRTLLKKVWNRIKSGKPKKDPAPAPALPRHPEAASPAPKAPPRTHERQAAPASRERARTPRRSEEPRGHSFDPHPRAAAPAAAPRAQDRKPWSLDEFQVPPLEGKVRFHDLDLPPELMQAIDDLDFKYCTPVQGEILPSALKGLDVSGRAQTGTGKTAAFLLTIFARLLRHPETEPRPHGKPRALITAPTRELVMQIQRDAEDLGRHCPFKTVAVYGGMDYDKQRKQLRDHPVEVVVATPGRLLDFKQKREVDLSRAEILVIDEADRMLDMGFIPDMRRIVGSTLSKEYRQTMLFSATLSPEILRLADQWMKNPVRVDIAPEQVAVDSVDQRIYIVTSREKFALLYNILKYENPERVIIFGNRRDETSDLLDYLRRYGITCALLSGSVPQEKRVRTLESFRSGQIRVLVATDVAGRGLHVEGISHIINYNIPRDAEDYVHRIGRTGRAGAKGISITFACEEESFYLPQIEEFIGHPLACIHPDESWLKLPHPPARRESAMESEGAPYRQKSARPRPRNFSGRNPHRR